MRGPQAACLEHVCCMLLFLYFPVTCNPSRSVTLSNIGVPHYIGVRHRVTLPKARRRSLAERRRQRAPSSSKIASINAS